MGREAEPRFLLQALHLIEAQQLSEAPVRQQGARQGVGHAPQTSCGRDLVENWRKGDDAQAGPA